MTFRLLLLRPASVATGDDTTAPAWASAEEGDVSNLVVAAHFSEALLSPTADYLTGFTITVEGIEATIASADLQTGDQDIYFTITSGEEAAAPDAITLEYSATLGDVEDLAGNPLEDLGPEVVVNNVGRHWRFNHPANSMQLAAL